MFHKESLPNEDFIRRDLLHGKLSAKKRPYALKRNETEGR